MLCIASKVAQSALAVVASYPVMNLHVLPKTFWHLINLVPSSFSTLRENSLVKLITCVTSGGTNLGRLPCKDQPST